MEAVDEPYGYPVGRLSIGDWLWGAFILAVILIVLWGIGKPDIPPTDDRDDWYD